MSYFNRKLQVGIVDDSPLIRQMIAAAISAQPDIEVAFLAVDPFDAREKIKTFNPDVITLDIEMPRMDGISFLKKIMSLRPMPVLMFSTLTQKGADATLQALESGAVDYVPKPTKDEGFEGYLEVHLIPKLHAIKAMIQKGTFVAMPKISPDITGHKGCINKSSYEVIVIASSTGGVERLRYLMTHLCPPCPPIVIVQHMNKQFTARMSERMQDFAPSFLRVKLATHNEKLQSNTVYIANNETHIGLRYKAPSFYIEKKEGPPVNGFIASADVMMMSLAETLSAVKRVPEIGAFILSGMGFDGAKGMRALKDLGVHTIGESEESCLIYGMSKAAMQQGGIETELPLHKIAQCLNGH